MYIQLMFYVAIVYYQHFHYNIDMMQLCKYTFFFEEQYIYSLPLFYIYCIVSL